jgi:hypothetical protein
VFLNTQSQFWARLKHSSWDCSPTRCIMVSVMKSEFCSMISPVPSPQDSQTWRDSIVLFIVELSLMAGSWNLPSYWP